jgi:selenocysteine lyase/cysteine desulfurase
MSMLMAESAPGTGDHKDALYFSPHKFIGGPQTPGCWWSGATWPATRMPTAPGGGTIAFVDPIGHRCLDDPLVQEGGTPAIVESIRAGPIVALKQAVGTDLIQAREQRSLARVLERWWRNPTWSCWAGAARASP